MRNGYKVTYTNFCFCTFDFEKAHLYDQYRHRMLHGRKPLMMKMPVEKVGIPDFFIPFFSLTALGC